MSRTLPIITRATLAEGYPAEAVDQVADGVSDIAQSALDALTAMEEQWAKEDGEL